MYNNRQRKYKEGDIVTFGNYYHSNSNIKEPIEWLVLEVSGNSDKIALLITKDAIDCKPYNEESFKSTWEKCTLRYWLNNEFINEAVTKEEQAEIFATVRYNPNNQKYGTYGGKIERINRKIKTIRLKRYSLLDDEYFFLKIIDASSQNWKESQS